MKDSPVRGPARVARFIHFIGTVEQQPAASSEKNTKSSLAQPQATPFRKAQTNPANATQMQSAKGIADQVIAAASKARGGDPRQPWQRVGDMYDSAKQNASSVPSSSLPRQSASDLATQILAAGRQARGE